MAKQLTLERDRYLHGGIEPKYLSPGADVSEISCLEDADTNPGQIATS